MKTRKIRIINDGASVRSRVLDAETGEPIADVVGVKWEHRAPGELPMVTLTLLATSVDLVGELGDVSIQKPMVVDVTTFEDQARRFALVSPEAPSA